MARVGVRLLLFIAIAATIGCDRLTKHAAATTLADSPARSFLADTIRLEYAENTGAFLGLGADWPRPVRMTIFAAANAALLTVLVIAARRGRWATPALVGVALIAAGGASNLVDRISYGTVIDFINVGIGPVRTGIFNVADVAIMLGAGILVSEGHRSGRQERLKRAD